MLYSAATHERLRQLAPLADDTRAPWYLSWMVSEASMLIFLGIAVAILIVVVFAWRVVTGRER